MLTDVAFNFSSLPPRSMGENYKLLSFFTFAWVVFNYIVCSINESTFTLTNFESNINESIPFAVLALLLKFNLVSILRGKFFRFKVKPRPSKMIKIFVHKMSSENLC